MTGQSRPTYVTIKFVQAEVMGRARLRWDDEPAICQAVVDAAPFEVRAHHAIFSGSEIAAITPLLPEVTAQSQTTEVAVGDLAYGALRAADHYGVEEDFTEICWFYDRDSRPSMFTGPFAVSPFARFDDAVEFMKASRAMRIDGAQAIRVDVE